MEREGTAELRREREGRISSMKEGHPGRLAALSQNAGAKLATPRRRCWELLGARPLSGTEHAHWGMLPPTRLLDTAVGRRARPHRLSPCRNVFAALTASAGGNGLGTFSRARPRASRLPGSPRWLWVPPSSSRPSAVPHPSSLASQAPPPRRGPPQVHGGPSDRALRPQSGGNLSADPTDDRAAGNGRGFLASAVAETPGRQ